MPLVQSPSTQPTTNRTDKVDNHDFLGLEEFEDDDDVEALAAQRGSSGSDVEFQAFRHVDRSNSVFLLCRYKSDKYAQVHYRGNSMPLGENHDI